MYQVSNVWIKDEGVTVEAFDTHSGELIYRFKRILNFFDALMLPSYPAIGTKGSLYELGLTEDFAVSIESTVLSKLSTVVGKVVRVGPLPRL